MTQAFHGVRILDFSQVFSGPFGVMQLALLGADVIKIEQPGGGDQTRRLMNEGPDRDMSPPFLGMNVNKRSLTLNLKQPEARDIVHRLMPTTDVIVENFRSGTMARHGLDYERLKAIKPDLIYCSITGYGQAGPRASDAAYDAAIQAASGMMSVTGHEASGPTRAGFMAVDMSTAINAAFAISASLYRKATTGEGQRLDVAMLDTAILMQAAQFDNYLVQGQQPRLIGNGSPTGQPTAGVFPTADGHIQITVIQQKQAEQLFSALGTSHLLSEPDFRSNESRRAAPDLVRQAICDALRHQTTAQWMKQLAATGIPVAEIRTVPEVAGDPAVHDRGVFRTMASPIDPGESVTVAVAGHVADSDGPAVRSAAPLLGQHTDEILTELGYSASERGRLRSDGTV
ncbi:MAG: CoA transferase [Proteobacteria bacterium]|jgi:crotonobetainyl-CoA:carnitine CoA-transferase CaiB-like acyl-CoA transferase|nr:CoA transferase [Pseudomonadota bacterium]MDA1299004.1 CoA transferase [Pseudomonadota bacterium]